MISDGPCDTEDSALHHKHIKIQKNIILNCKIKLKFHNITFFTVFLINSALVSISDFKNGKNLTNLKLLGAFYLKLSFT